MANIQPNRFTLQNTDGTIKVDYETTSFIGQPSLSLTLPPGHPIRHFGGSQIRTLNTEIGLLVSVTTHLTVDAGSTSFSFFLPAIALKATSERQAFSTEAIITAHAGPISLPLTGVHEKYQFVPLKGEASFVLSVFGPLAEARQ